jgi:hypothetical protein
MESRGTESGGMKSGGNVTMESRGMESRGNVTMAWDGECTGV